MEAGQENKKSKIQSIDQLDGINYGISWKFVCAMLCL